MYTFSDRIPPLGIAEELIALGPVVPFRIPGLPSPYDSVVITDRATAKSVLADRGFVRGIENYRQDVSSQKELHYIPKTFSVDMILTKNGVEHRELRNFFMKWFNDDGVQRIESFLNEVMRDIIHTLKSMPQACCVDLKPYVQQISMRVICAIAGIEPSERIAAFVDAAFTEGKMEAMVEYITEVVAATNAPEGTILGELKQHDLGVKVSAFSQILTAGYKTSNDGILSLYKVLLAECPWLVEAFLQAEEVERLAIWEKMVKESLRRDPPIPFAPVAYPLEDRIIKGRRIPAGWPVIFGIQPINVSWDAAGDNPLAFDPWRERCRHITFGAGPHYCIGAGMAEAEMMASRALLEAFPGMRICGEHSRPDTVFPLMTRSHRNLCVDIWQ